MSTTFRNIEDEIAARQTTGLRKADRFAVNYAVAYIQHADVLDPGFRTPYRDGMFVDTCVCGRTFEGGDPQEASVRLTTHIEHPDFTDDEIETELS
jgi:hypothetical protein